MSNNTNTNTLRFFQNEKKFVIGDTYETLRVRSPPYDPKVKIPIDICDEVGVIIPKSEIYLGKYVDSARYGWGDNSGRIDYFINDQGEKVAHYLEYDGTTRYRRVKSHMEERLPFLKLVESTGVKKNEDNKNEHINKYVLNELITMEVCTFMNPVLK
jgi:hypothetical protein